MLSTPSTLPPGGRKRRVSWVWGRVRDGPEIARSPGDPQNRLPIIISRESRERSGSSQGNPGETVWLWF
ncbi:hypothetical protein MPH_00649 [Macrophomina phaseolina MS6]|uniref:Uncharacterized protein n=1 Tax=Macrophomina phaseolina (strain MS6) TaxID=1126212 RepID=K2S5B9_MACPH|nr:hypothetical protein MPH_00649 [Macrophomina phaseolina MS6]